MSELTERLLGGDLRSIGNSEAIAKEIISKPSLIEEVVHAMNSDNPLLRMRASDTVEKVAKLHPEYLLPFKCEIIHEISKIEQQEVQWHVAQLFSYMDLSADEQVAVVNRLKDWISKSKSKIVIVNSIQAIVDIAVKNPQFKNEAISILEQQLSLGKAPSILSRCKKLLKKFVSENYFNSI